MLSLKGIPRFEPRTAHHKNLTGILNAQNKDKRPFHILLDLNMWQIMAKL